MTLFVLLAGAGVVIGGVLGTVFFVRRRTEARVAAIRDRLHDGASFVTEASVRVEETAALPAPVRRYLTHVLTDGQAFVAAVAFTQRGTFRGSTDATAGWSAFAATHHVTTRSPGFVWEADIDMMPGVPVRVLDAYVQGRGRLWARVGDVLTVMDPPGGPALNEGELMRYLAEAPLYPTALLPMMGVHWTPIDDRAARATLHDRGTTVSLVFHFNEHDVVERVSGWRPFTRTDGPPESRPWTGYWRAYEDRGGMWVPTEGTVAWGQAPNEVAYWRGHIETAAYEFCTLAPPFAAPPSSLRDVLGQAPEE
jgi:hypothetical protein